MSPSTPLTVRPPVAAPADPDLAEQARPGHGIPSQDPEPAAQLPLTAAESQREAGSVWTGGGMVAGAATGAALGAVLAGPVGVVVGGTVGVVAGALGGAAAGAPVKPDDAPADEPAASR
ncbi:MAG: bacteriocin [Polaromonas sp.]|nr:bacteriocin [Polaromonas sp.]